MRSLRPSTPALRPCALLLSLATRSRARSAPSLVTPARQRACPRACNATRPASVRDSSSRPEHAPYCPLAKRCSVRGVPECVRVGTISELLVRARRRLSSATATRARFEGGRARSGGEAGAELLRAGVYPNSGVASAAPSQA
ncbi:hypothetical protein B0H15DRAFT_462104 [Mycena belliarum]|uniref:Secreted protein n=1 Tax=Mycena belliarum TaxID=1033014 RepID=A0AAD6UEH6_9AGAR|nr:hypothetical protein B0H15DRAFT_462098 [Mycena belliae]KAJ7100815.1 hypothetical protein B0H15DRAFT_462104 [Mycena belliae]